METSLVVSDLSGECQKYPTRTDFGSTPHISTKVGPENFKKYDSKKFREIVQK